MRRARRADGLDYNEPPNATLALQGWFQELIAIFPPMNGRLSSADSADDDWTADYSIARDMIVVAFPWSKAEAAYELTRRLAGKHGVGFFDASAVPSQWRSKKLPSRSAPMMQTSLPRHQCASSGRQSSSRIKQAITMCASPRGNRLRRYSSRRAHWIGWFHSGSLLCSGPAGILSHFG